MHVSNNRNLKEIKPGRFLLLRILYHLVVATWNDEHRLIIKDNKSSWALALKRRRSALFFIFLVISMPFLVLSTIAREFEADEPRYKNFYGSLTWDEYNDFNPLRSSDIEPHPNYEIRKEIYRNNAASSNSFGALSAKIYNNISLSPSNEDRIRRELYNEINPRDDTAEFELNNILRIMWLDVNKSLLDPGLKDEIKNAVLGFRYWHTEPDLKNDNMIFWTENHQIAFHTAELLAGLLYPNETFTNSNMTGMDHVNHAVPMILDWLGWKAQIGFTEWHSITYYAIDVFSLANLIDYSNNTEIITKACMVLDLLVFDMACHFYKGDFATTHGRAYSRNRVAFDPPNPAWSYGIETVAWLLLGISDTPTSDWGDFGCVSISQSEIYVPPPILEDIANNASSYIEHKDRMCINIEDGPKYGYDYSQENLMFWWHMAGQVDSHTIDAGLAEIDDYDVSVEALIGLELVLEVLKVGAFIHGTDISGFCELVKGVTQGVALEEVNTYTYRTPYYQLSGAQDHAKGLASLQEHIWQASIDRDAIVYTNWPGGISFKGGEFIGGWKPRATFYKNVGVIQHDRESMSLDAEMIFFAMDKVWEYFYEFEDREQYYYHIYPYIHAYFPQWAFDQVVKEGNWIFGKGKEGGGYIAFYSHEKSYFVNQYDYRTRNSRKNIYIVEMGSAVDDGSFDSFISRIVNAPLQVVPEAMGYQVRYESPSQGLVTVDWNDPMIVDGAAVDLGSYKRFDNIYCQQEFNTTTTIIQFENQTLTLDFDAVNRSYTG